MQAQEDSKTSHQFLDRRVLSYWRGRGGSKPTGQEANPLSQDRSASPTSPKRPHDVGTNLENGSSFNPHKVNAIYRVVPPLGAFGKHAHQSQMRHARGNGSHSYVLFLLRDAVALKRPWGASPEPPWGGGTTPSGRKATKPTGKANDRHQVRPLVKEG